VYYIRTVFLKTIEDGEKDEDDPNLRADCVATVIQGQVYSNSVDGGVASGRLRSRSYDLNLDQAPPPRLGSLEHTLSCPVRLSDTVGRPISPPPRVTSFAEIARSKRKSGGGGSPTTLRGGSDAGFSKCPRTSLDAFALPEQQDQGGNPGPSSLAGCCSLGSLEPCVLSGLEAQAQGTTLRRHRQATQRYIGKRVVQWGEGCLSPLAPR